VVIGLARLSLALLALAGAGRSSAASIPAARRCELVSRILDFRVEIHPGTFRSSVIDDPETHRLAYWHDRPVVCAYTSTREHDEAPLFSSDESCKSETFDLFNATISQAVDGPRACVGIQVTATGSGHVHFSARLNVTKVPTGYPADEGRGVGFAPVEGSAVWGRHGWALRQMFKPK